MFILHNKYHHSIYELAEMFKITVKYAAFLIKTMSVDLNLNQERISFAITPNEPLEKIEKLIMKEVNSKQGAITAPFLKLKINKELGINISQATIIKCMKEQLNLSWKRLWRSDPYVNTPQNIALRQQFAIELLSVIKENKILFNFDESVLQFSNNSQFSWEKSNVPALRQVGKKIQGLSIMTTISSIGDVYFQYIDGYNNEITVPSYFMKLEEHLSKANPEWRENSILLMDNCSSHKTKMVRKILKVLSIPTIFSAPASYKAMPVELLFGAIKKKEYLAPDTPEIVIYDGNKKMKLTNKQRLMLEIGQYLKTIEKSKIVSLFLKQLSNLSDFLEEKRV